MNSKSEKKYEIILASVIAARASSFLFCKLLLSHLGKFNLVALRFLIAFLMLSVIFRKSLLHISKKSFLSGVIIGVLFFATITCELTALTQADSALVSLLENCSIIFVPLFSIAIDRRLPDRITCASVLIAMTGVLFLALSQNGLSGGFLFALLAAVCYALAIIVTAKLSRECDDTLAVGIIQVGTIGVLALAVSLISGPFTFPSSSTEWLMLFILIVVCTVFGFTLQPVAQSHVSADRAGLFCAISPAIACLLGVIVLHEKFTSLSFLGLVLILLSILLPYIMNIRAKRKNSE